MKKKRVFYCIILILSCTILFSSCNKNEKEKKSEKLPEGSVYAYFIDSDSTELIRKKYKLADPSNRKKSVKELITLLGTPQKEMEYRAPIPENVKVLDISIVDSNVIINFALGYEKLTSCEEILLRSAVVSTLTEVSGVETVEFKINGKSLTNIEEHPVGPMGKRSFVDAIQDENGNINSIVKLYFTDESGKKLKSYEVTLRENKIPIDQKVLELLIEGPMKKGYYRTLPKDLKVLKVSTKNRVCYIDLNSKILEPYKNVVGEISIYSIVDSLVALPNIDKVQFTINGKKVNTIRENITFDKSFERNLDLIQGE
ncbi:MAG: GerMN domain-containing protein [Lachnospiraceae bacterium]